MSKKLVFLSSSGDLSLERSNVRDRLEGFLRSLDMSADVRLYLWEDETRKGDLLVDRLPIQPQLEDVFGDAVCLTICMFGEKIGTPLDRGLSDSVLNRFEPFRAQGSDPGILFPWPETDSEQLDALNSGQYPLTGTTFELLGSILSENQQDGLVIGFVADKNISLYSSADEVVFNRGRLLEREAPLSSTPRDVWDRYETRVYRPNVCALTNLLKELQRRSIYTHRYTSAEHMVADVSRRAREKLTRRFGDRYSGNPFKATLEHWRASENRDLPGRRELIRHLVSDLRRPDGELRVVLITGVSGCGKSSVLDGGVMRKMALDGTVTLAVRPPDLTDPNGSLSRLTMLWDLICGVLEPSVVPRLADTSAGKVAEMMAEALVTALASNNQKLVLGLDQFEEMLDDMRVYVSEREKPKGYWQVLTFIRHAIASGRVSVIGTLESRRESVLDEIGVREHLNVSVVTRDVADDAEQIEAIAKMGFASRGIELDDSLCTAIKNEWKRWTGPGAASAGRCSPLPLAGLWLARLYDQKSYLASNANVGSIGSLGISDAMNLSAGQMRKIRLSDLPEAVSFDDLIGEMCEDAWDASGASREESGAPDVSTLANFLHPLVEVDIDGSMRLVAASQDTGLTSQDALMLSFAAARLLVPAGVIPIAELEVGCVPRRHRLVHQAVIDRWLPAKAWMEEALPVLAAEAEFVVQAERWNQLGRKQENIDEFLKSGQKNRIQQAASILAVNRVYWPALSDRDMPVRQANLRAFTYEIFDFAEDPKQVALSGPSGKLNVHVAATHHRLKPLERFLSRRNSLLSNLGALVRRPVVPVCEMRDRNGNCAIQHAAWCDGPALLLLLNNGGQATAIDSLGWHPIAAAIQRGALDNFKTLFEYYTDVNIPIGPDGITMLHEAAASGRTSMIRKLLKFGANPKVSTETAKYLPIHIAALNGQADAVELLLPRVSVLDKVIYERNIFHLAACERSGAVIRRLLKSVEISRQDLEKGLKARDKSGFTPLMLSASFRMPEPLQALLSTCDPSSEEHQGKESGTLFHFALVWPSECRVGNDYRIRTRVCVEIILADGRLYPTKPDEQTGNLYRTGAKFPEALRALRRDPRMPASYEDLTSEMRRDDLSQGPVSQIVALVSDAPHALTEIHGSQRGLEIMISSGRKDALEALLRGGHIAADVVDMNMASLASIVTEEDVSYVESLVDAALSGGGDEARGRVLDAAFRVVDENLVGRIVDEGVYSVIGQFRHKFTAFHMWATKNELEVFQRMAAIYKLPLPLDAWGRRPSDLAPESASKRVCKIEDTFFEAPASAPFETYDAPPLFHMARYGDHRRFARYASVCRFPLPIDVFGRIPSDLAADSVAEIFRDIEARHFPRSN